MWIQYKVPTRRSTSSTTDFLFATSWQALHSEYGYLRPITSIFNPSIELFLSGKSLVFINRFQLLFYSHFRTAAPTQKYRDNLKYLTAMEDGQAAYLLLGVEAQSEVSYAMPVRDMLYDAMQYAQQVEKAARSHREEARKQQEKEQQGMEYRENGQQNLSGGHVRHSGKRERISSGEFLGGFYKGDRLLPVITLVLLFSPDPWDGPMSIHEMLSDVEEELLPFIADYRINLIAPAAMDATSIERFQSSLRQVLLYIKYSRDKKQLVHRCINPEVNSA